MKTIMSTCKASGIEASTPTGNCLRPLYMLMVLKQVGNPVFLTGLSSAQTFSTGSLLRSSCSYLVNTKTFGFPEIRQQVILKR